MKKFIEFTIEKKAETTCVLAYDDGQYRDGDPRLAEFAIQRVRVKCNDYFRDEYPDYVVTERRGVGEQSYDYETMPPPGDWHDKIMARVTDDYRDPLGDVVIENRDGWRRVLLVGGVKAVVDGPAFRLGRYVTVDGRRALEGFGGNANALMTELVDDFRAAFPATTLSDYEIVTRFQKELDW